MRIRKVVTVCCLLFIFVCCLFFLFLSLLPCRRFTDDYLIELGQDPVPGRHQRLLPMGFDQLFYITRDDLNRGSEGVRCHICQQALTQLPGRMACDKVVGEVQRGDQKPAPAQFHLEKEAQAMVADEGVDHADNGLRPG